MQIKVSLASQSVSVSGGTLEGVKLVGTSSPTDTVLYEGKETGAQVTAWG